MPKIVIDNKELQVEENISLLKACLCNGIYIPHLCFMEELQHPSASCRLCFAQVGGQTALSCAVKVREGMIVRTDTPQVRRLQISAFRLLMSVHHIIPKCPAKKTCELIKIAKFLGVSLKMKDLPKILKEPEIDTSHPLFDIHLNRCVLCEKCIHICRITHGHSLWTFIKRGFDMTVRYYGKQDLSMLPCKDCLRCMDICPVKAITLK